MKKKRNNIEADDLAIYEPVNSKFREQMFMKWRLEEMEHELCRHKCNKNRNRKGSARRRQHILQLW